MSIVLYWPIIPEFALLAGAQASSPLHTNQFDPYFLGPLEAAKRLVYQKIRA
jgi:hypothetical protein